MKLPFDKAISRCDEPKSVEPNNSGFNKGKRDLSENLLRKANVTLILNVKFLDIDSYMIRDE